MRFVTRLHACIFATILFIAYFSWFQPSVEFQTRLQKVWKDHSHRVVVFGDDWSDVGEYRMAPPPKSTIRDKDPDRGGLWTETLCKELVCDWIDNFARSVPSNVEIATIGSLVDGAVYAKATTGKRNETLALFDFGAQVRQFLDFEKQKRLMPSRLLKHNEWTIFTVFFGIWDLLEYSALDRAEAVHAIDRSVEQLFHNLNFLAENVDGPPKVVIPQLVDVTYLPRFQMKKNDSAGGFAMDQHQKVFLWTYWNSAVSHAAATWSRGDIYMPDLNGIVMNLVRAKQLYAANVTDASGFGKQMPLFDEIEEPCLLSKMEDDDLQTADVKKCFDPTRHLFWDSMHLSGPAHQLIGQEAARLVRANSTINLREQTQGSATGRKSNKKERPAGFNLKFPPGY
ncbi:hypothetical protein K491DRAFT_601560 [Lophiostoma macrostomum CBS 122681]|uniref:Carbohydrate esterase family 16 protein n=1 Tax=Lophiostoma macrostomum CBS 122681 TaxID=1314788 RepID=A0A6A6T6B4_9PLEO|nr:hypothetical protein K491DRAFT_601560 [Lophiostoma macrostomum CBS 122681]